MRFEWDERKNRINVQKHGLSFEEAAKIFDHPALTWFDDRGLYGEDRYISIGFVGSVLATVVFVQKSDHVTRIISARKATRHEERQYERGY
ncbi:BrnT family toxin [Duganella sp. LX20W]|uniref:BrnT family toxin n=1 Tax=Rugamonas brunnea TaxID=2758569 RepID=A0A7W2EPG3_9BURK|nr:BrnT family toxin [Rugamonas brunnea]MBA5636220.1 BrnT family toxin [Rugamonas brunnea]